MSNKDKKKRPIIIIRKTPKKLGGPAGIKGRCRNLKQIIKMRIKNNTICFEITNETEIKA